MPSILERMDYEAYRAKIDAANVRIGELTAERDRVAARSPVEIAAPAMLAALKEAHRTQANLLRLYEELQGHETAYSRESKAAQAKIAAAIASAEGRAVQSFGDAVTDWRVRNNEA